MSVYFMASISITNDQEYQLYLDRSEEIFARYKGSYLAVDSRAVLIRFDKKEDFDAWYQSGEYQEILQYRLSAAECDTILIQGK